MKKSHFNAIAKASADFVQHVDSMIPYIKKHEAEDCEWADFNQEKRRKERAAYVEAKIKDSADVARYKVNSEIAAMKAAFKKYMTTTTDPQRLQSLKAIIDAGVELTDKELAAYAENGDYPTLRMLEPHSRGRVKAPDPDRFEHDMIEIAFWFRGLTSYCGPHYELSEYTKNAYYYGLSNKVSGAIIKGMLVDHIKENLDEIAERWSMVKED